MNHILVIGILVLFQSTNSLMPYCQIRLSHNLIRRIKPTFLSIGLDSGWVRGNFCNIDWSKAMKYGKALSPAYLRFGGNDADRMVFDPDAPDSDSAILSAACDATHKPLRSNFTINSNQFDTLMMFVNQTGWRLVFDLNALLRTKDNKWNSSNAELLLDYAARSGGKINFELGNEPNDWKHKFGATVSAEQLGKDFIQLDLLLKKYPSFKDSKIVGPSISQPKNMRRLLFLRQFLKTAYKTVDSVTFHQYYLNGRNTSQAQFLDTDIMDRLKQEIQSVVNMVKSFSQLKRKKIESWLGETASAFGGGAPGLSDTYVSGFLWMDKLGLSLSMGLDVVVRQSFYRGHYALLDKNSDPNPDYWITYLFKKLVGNGVLRTILGDCQVNKEKVRMYAVCSDRKLVFFGMNLSELPVNLFFQYVSSFGKAYILEPRDGDLLSKKIYLNGVLLEKELPSLNGQPIFYMNAILPPKRYGFFVFDKIYEKPYDC